MNCKEMLSAKDIHKRYGPVEVLKGVDIGIKGGEIVSIVGPSGSGKSTLLHILGTLDKPDRGEVFLGDEAISGLQGNKLASFRNKHIGFVFQFHHLLPEFSALENIMMPQMIAGLAPKEAQVRAKALLDYMRIGHRGDHRPAELSGGEQQRVAIARAVANAPLLLLADEPTGNLDPETASYVFDALEALVRQSGLAALIATHNHDLAARMDRRVTLSEGKIVEF